MKVTFLGGGSFGTSLAKVTNYNGHDVIIYERKEETVNEINKFHTNKKYLKDIVLDEKIVATLDLSYAVKNADIIVFSVPSNVIEEMCNKIKDIYNKDAIIVSIAKGVDPKTYKPLSTIFENILNVKPVILSGPSHAEEVAQNLPTTLVASSKSENYMKAITNVFSNENLRVYKNDDLIGVEIGGAVKNIIALAAGISDGIGFGDNAKAALMTRGMAEIIRIGTKLGANESTFYGLTGIGDLIVTCSSMHSRNRRCGILIGQGKSMDEAVNEIGMVVEGIKACKSFYELSHNLNVEMPITESVYSILFLNKSPKRSNRSYE